MDNMKKFTKLLLLLLVSFGANAAQYDIDLSDCTKKSCFSKLKKTFVPSDNVEILAWFDILSPKEDGDHDFYPLFNVYNRTSSELKCTIGMQLLDSDGNKLVEAFQEYKFKQYSPSASAYEAYRSINAVSISKDVMKKTKSINVIYKK